MIRPAASAVGHSPIGFLLAVLLVAAFPATARGDPFAACEERFAADPQGWKSCDCFYRVAISEGLHDEAVARLEGHRRGDPENPCLAFTLGRLHLLRRGGGSAAPLLREAAAGYRARGLADGEVYARINLASALATLGAAGEEIAAELDRARRVAEETGDRVLRAEVALKEARLLVRRGGDVGRIEASLRWVWREAFAEAHASLRRDTLLALGDVLYSRGRFADAEEVFAEAVAVTVEAEDRFGEAAARLNRAAAAGAQLPHRGQRAEVIRLLGEAVDAAEAAGHPFVEIEARVRLGTLLGGAEGRGQLERAVELAGGFRDRAPELLAGALAASAMELVDDDPAEARRRVDEASALLATASDPWSQVYGWADRLRVLWATAPREEALAAATGLLGLVERLEKIQSTETARVEVSSVWTEIYQWLAGRLLADAEAGEGTVDEAFAISERMRARLLLESLAAGGVGPAAAADGENEAAWLEVERGIVDLHRRLLDPGLEPAERGELLAELEELEAREDRFAARQRQLRRGSLAEVRSFVQLADLQADLASDEAVLAFQVGEWQALDGSFTGGSWLLAVTAGAIRIHRLPGREELVPAVEVFLHLFERRDGSEAEPAAALYETLLAEALAGLPEGVERLVIVPDGPLHRLPFAALRSEPGEPPLADRYELFVTPSATVWRQLRGSAPSGDLTLAVADPAVPGGGEVLGDGGEGADRSWTAGLVLPVLPNARREGRAALRHLGRPGRLLVDEEATEAAVKAEARGGLRLLHLGTHAVLDEANPNRSAVVLAPGAPDQDGLLRPREAAALDLGGAVVVLAACQSAQGTVLQGEGALSLARAFLEGGATAVVGSLWPLDDEESAELFDRFYRHLGRGQTVARALALAQRQTRQAGAPAAAWAGLVVLGDGEAVVAPPSADASPRLPSAARLGGAVVLALLLAATIAAIVRWRRRAG